MLFSQHTDGRTDERDAHLSLLFFNPHLDIGSMNSWPRPYTHLLLKFSIFKLFREVALGLRGP